MAAKLLHSLTDENPDLQRQIGCMTGVFQLFDRHHVLSTRRISGHSPKRLIPHGSSEYNSGTCERESNNIHHRPLVMERSSNKNIQEKHKTSTESSRASFSSSSRSSSFSSLDCNKIVQPDPLSFDRIIFPETPSRDSAMSQSSPSPRLGRQSLDLRDVVKDSMYRDFRGISPKTTTNEATDPLMRHRDSPRPLQKFKVNDDAYSVGSGLNLKQNRPADLKESVRALAKLREAPWYFDEPRELSRSKSFQLKEGSSLSSSKDAPRFSCDGREMNRLSLDSRDNSKPSLKIKELPRLSLDSRERSMRNHYSDQKSIFLPRNSNRDAGNSSDEAMNLQKTPGTLSQTSVIAKLMGLDTLPDFSSGSHSKMGSGMGLITSRPPEDFDSFPRSLKTTEQREPIRLPSPSRSTLKVPKSPRWKNPDTVVMKPISKFPMDPEPWRQIDGPQNSQKPASRKPPLKAHSPFPSVYSEIEKRLKHLEFTQSGKDLRALEQILEAMQVKGFLETGNGAQDSHFFTQNNQDQRYSNFTSNGKAQGSQSQIISSANRGSSSSSEAFESPIVIMKPAKLVEKSLNGSSSVIRLGSRRVFPVGSKTAKDQIPKSNRTDNTINTTGTKTSARHVKPIQTSARQPLLSKESATSPAKSSGSISPRLQQRKLEVEKRSRPPTPPSDSIKSRKQTSKQQVESNSPGGRRRPKYSNYHEGDDQLNGTSREMRNLSCQETEVGLQSDSERYGETIVSPCLSAKGGSYSPMSKPKKSTRITYESFGELSVVAKEYPSPVSVLDVVYIDDSPSPVKHVPKTPKDDVTQNSFEKTSTEQGKEEADAISSTIRSSVTSEINRKKLQNIDNLVQKLTRLNSCHDEARTDYIASLCDNTNPDHRYISEILLASGFLLRDLGSSLTTFQFHPSGHPINPELFSVLEQTKSSSLLNDAQKKPDKEKLHRMLIFDTVNELLVEKLGSVVQSQEPWLRPSKIARKPLNGQKLLRDLCTEIEEVQAKKQECSSEEVEGEDDDGLKDILLEDVTRRSESWTDFLGEIPVMVLEVERLIFKDLVNEIVMDGSSGLKGKQHASRRCFSSSRFLFLLDLDS